MSEQHSVIVALEATGDLRAHCRTCDWRGPSHPRGRIDPSASTGATGLKSALKLAQDDGEQHRLETRAATDREQEMANG